MAEVPVGGSEPTADMVARGCSHSGFGSVRDDPTEDWLFQRLQRGCNPAWHQGIYWKAALKDMEGEYKSLTTRRLLPFEKPRLVQVQVAMVKIKEKLDEKKVAAIDKDEETRKVDTRMKVSVGGLQHLEDAPDQEQVEDQNQEGNQNQDQIKSRTQQRAARR